LGDESPSFVSFRAGELVARGRTMQMFTTGSEGLDRILGGGYRCGRVYEFYGESGTGKTQLAMQAALCAAGAGARALFIDAEGTLRPERLDSVAHARGWSREGLLDLVQSLRVASAREQMETVTSLAVRPETADSKLVVLDSLTRNFTLDFPGQSNVMSRQGAMDVHLSEMARDAVLHGRAYVLTNRVTFGAQRVVRIGGLTVQQLVSSSVRLERVPDGVSATLEDGGGSTLLRIGARGVE
jgi:DNA repair protein RadA